MKQVLLISFALLVFFPYAFSQSPQLIPYQAVARDAAGNLLVNQNVGLRFTVHDATATGSVQYQESQTATTNKLGLFNVSIGAGTVLSGSFSGILWGNGNAKFMQVEIDPAGGTSYTNLGASQMMSVPYALYAGNATLTAGTGIGVSGNTISETLPFTALTTSGNSGAASISAGTLNIPGYTLAGLGGQAALTAGTGIGIASNTITNTGVTSIVAGSNISISGGTGAVTINDIGIYKIHVPISMTVYPPNTTSYSNSSPAIAEESGQYLYLNGGGSITNTTISVTNPATATTYGELTYLANYVCNNTGDKVSKFTGWMSYNIAATNSATIYLYWYKNPVSTSGYGTAIAGTLLGSQTITGSSSNIVQSFNIPISANTMTAGDVLVVWIVGSRANAPVFLSGNIEVITN